MSFFFANRMDFSIHRPLFDINPFADGSSTQHTFFWNSYSVATLCYVPYWHSIIWFVLPINPIMMIMRNRHTTPAQKITQYFDIELRHRFFFLCHFSDFAHILSVFPIEQKKTHHMCMMKNDRKCVKIVCIQRK